MVRKSPTGLVLAIFLAGCASTDTNYTPPPPAEVSTETVLVQPFAKAWDAYVAELSRSFYVINNISRDSGIINVSFSAQQPVEFIDCGYTTRTTRHPSIGSRDFRYATAGNADFLIGGQGNALWTMTRRTTLSGRANIYMARRGSGTLLRVNAKYVWTVTVAGRSNTGGNYRDSFTVDFVSNQAGVSTGPADDSGRQLTCHSLGVLERRLLELGLD